MADTFTADEWNSFDERLESDPDVQIVSRDAEGKVKEYTIERGRGIAEKALKIINGERQNAYGEPEDSFAAIAAFWTAYLKNKAEFFISTEDVAYMMVLFKLARMLTGTQSHDSKVDMIGYALLGATMGGKK